MAQSTVEASHGVLIDLTEEKPIHVLLVDDESGLLKIAKQCLKMEGSFHVDTVSSVEEAVKKLEKKTYDAVVSDYRMPGKDGLEFLKELRDRDNTIPFIMFTGRGKEEVAIKALNLGADRYLNKAGAPETVYGELAHSIRKAVKRNRSEERLRESEERYRSLVELAPDSIVTFDLKGVITSCNTASTKMTGYSKDEIVGKHFSKLRFLRARDIPKYLKLLSSAARGKVPEPLEINCIRKDGTPYLAEVCFGLLKEGGKTIGFQVIGRDITERKRAEERLRESEEKFRNLAEQSPSMIFINKNGKIVYANEKCEEIMGYKREEFYSPDFNFFTLIAPESRNRVKASFSRHRQGGEVAPYEYTLATKEGRTMDAILTTRLIRYEGEQAILGTVTDITEYKRSERSLKDTLKKLEMVNEKLSVVGRLARHDVRNKLSAVIGNVYLVKKLTDDPKVHERLSDIESACRQTERIFEFAKTYEMLGVEELAYVDVEESLDGAVSLFSDLHGTKIENKCRGLTLLADSLLNQLFYNLIDNSLKHGGKVRRIRVRYEEAGKDQLKLVYEDDGVGIQNVEKKMIFKEGYGKHTGYGLYLIKKICEVYGWTIQETGKQGKGAQFTITIPRVNERGKINYRFD